VVPRMPHLLQIIPWIEEGKHAGKYSVVVDDSFAEAFKWNDLASEIPPEVEVRPLHDGCTTSLGCLRAVVFMSSLSIRSVTALKCILGENDACEVHILTSVGETAASAISYSKPSQRSTATKYSGYEGLLAYLAPHSVVATYFPLHSTKLLRQVQTCHHRCPHLCFDAELMRPSLMLSTPGDNGEHRNGRSLRTVESFLQAHHAEQSARSGMHPRVRQVRTAAHCER
jgi:hypothetical protein